MELKVSTARAPGHRARTNPLHGVESFILLHVSSASFSSSGIHYMELKVAVIAGSYVLAKIIRIHYMELKGLATSSIACSFPLRIHYMELKDLSKHSSKH